MTTIGIVSPGAMGSALGRAWAAGGARVVGSEVGSASAVKMCTASVYKGTTALWAQALQTAHALGVLDVVLADVDDLTDVLRRLSAR